MGDVIDVKLTFPRPVQAVGNPTINLTDAGNDTAQFVFTYVDVNGSNGLMLNPMLLRTRKNLESILTYL